MTKEKMARLHARWIGLCHRLAEISGQMLDPEIIDLWWSLIMVAYTQPHRHHHNLDHIFDGLAEFDAAAHLFPYPTAAEFAFFFHDFEYDIPAQPKGNEALSAERAAECAKMFALEAGSKFVRRTISYIKATDPANNAKLDEGQKLVASIDRAILAKPWPKYAEYALGIRREYGAVPLEVYREKRAEFLENFSKGRIFPDDTFAEQYEKAAKANMRMEVSLLKGKQLITA